MKRTALLLALMLLLGLLAGCNMAAPAAQPGDAAAATPSPTAAPTPTPAPPEGLEKVFGKEISIAVWEGDSPELLAGVTYEANRLGIPLVFAQDAATANTADVCIGYELSAEQTAQLTVPLVLFTTDSLSSADALIHYDGASETAIAWDTLFSYPAHESPIRLLALFDEESFPAAPEPEEIEGAAEEVTEEEENEAVQVIPDPYAGLSDSARTFMQWQDAGKLYSRGHFSGLPEDASPWMSETLSDITVGLLDTVYAQTPALAMAGYEALFAANRMDAVEIITAGLDEALLNAMIEDHFLMGAAAGPDRWSAGALAVRMGAALLMGEATETITLAPTVLYADDVYATLGTGLSDPAAIAISLNPELTALYQSESIEYLAQYAAQ